jgi:hypothetical protein
MYQARNGVVQGQNWAGTPTNQIPLRETLRAVQERIAPTVERYGNGNGDLYNSIIRTGSEMLPGVGDLVGIEDLQNAAQGNDWGGIGLGLLSAIPGIPAIGRGGRGTRRAGRLLDDAPAPSAGLLGENAPTYRVERSQDLAPTDTPESLRAQGYEIDPATNTWARTVGTEAPPVDYPIRAFHGSPHSFDRFSLDKIGTGEGAQAYGHGLYFAESEGVARQYRDTLAGDGLLRPDGTVWNPQSLQHMNIRVAANQNGADLEATIARARDVLGRAIQSSPPQTIAMARSDLAELEALRDAGGVRPNPGSMYEVGINADPETFLDWDRPLSEQPAMMERFRSDAAEPLFGRIPWGDRQIAAPSPDQTPWQVIKEYEDLRGPAGVREALQNLGINGVRYLDGNSRYAPDMLPDNPISNEARQWLDVAQGDSAEALRQFNASNPIERFAGPERDEVRKVIEAAARRPTSNYVLFDDELVKIIRKYGISGLGLGAGLSAFGYNEPAEQSLPDL